jgi:hypothetical protein
MKGAAETKNNAFRIRAQSRKPSPQALVAW